jgi:hypothetical protein
MYRGYELVPVKDGEDWEVQIFSGGRRITQTSYFAREEPAMIEAKNIVDDMRCSRRSA